METVTVNRQVTPSGGTRSTFKYETTYTGNTGNDLGVSTVGYRSAKHNPSEWHEDNYSKYYQSFEGRDGALETKNAATDVIRESLAAEQKV